MTETPLPNLPSQREPTADLLKGIAVLLMVQVHLVELFALPEIAEGSLGRFFLFLGGPPAAPVFMAVMGYFLGESAVRPRRYYLRRGLLLLCGGLFLNVGLNLNLLVGIATGRFDLNPFHYVFGADILPLAGLSIIVIGLLRTFLRENVAAYIALAFAIVAVTEHLPSFAEYDVPLLWYVNAFLWGEYSWSYFPLFPWLAYPLVGHAYRILREQYGIGKDLPVKDRLIVSTLIAIGLVSTHTYSIGVSSDLSLYYHHGVAFAGWVVLFLIGWLAAVSVIADNWGDWLPFRYVRWLGRYVTSAYVFQWLLIGNTATEVYRTVGAAGLVLWFVIILVAMSLCVAGWSKFLVYIKSRGRKR